MLPGFHSLEGVEFTSSLGWNPDLISEPIYYHSTLWLYPYRAATGTLGQSLNQMLCDGNNNTSFTGCM